MRILYVFPHPDDESFGPAPAIARQRRDGHDVYLLTLTRGGATRQRHKYGYSVEAMGEVRFQEMQRVARVLDLSELIVRDLPDSGLKELDPREIEEVVATEVRRLAPHVLVTYAVHGVSGFHDHLVSHAVVKHAFVALRGEVAALQRLAFFTLTQEAAQGGYFPLSGSTPEEIDCVVPVSDDDLARTQRALDCYETFQETIEKTGIRDFFTHEVHFEFFQERHDPPLADLCFGLQE
jgi:LmbE family N-acetylglucosaminyl deacetylase